MTFPSFESTDYLSARLSENQSVSLPAKLSLFCTLVLCLSFFFSTGVFVFLCASLPIFSDQADFVRIYKLNEAIREDNLYIS